MSRLFATTRELNLISDLTKEIIKNFSGQTVIVYPINKELTKTNDLYNESDTKIFDTPIEIRALVEFKGEVEVTTTNWGIDSKWELAVYFHKQDIVDKNINLRDGDFLQYGGKFYEIMAIKEIKDVFGINEQIVGMHADCRIARQSQFTSDNISFSPDNFELYRGSATGHQVHDKRKLFDQGIIEPLSGAINIKSSFKL